MVRGSAFEEALTNLVCVDISVVSGKGLAESAVNSETVKEAADRVSKYCVLFFSLACVLSSDFHATVGWTKKSHSASFGTPKAITDVRWYGNASAYISSKR